VLCGDADQCLFDGASATGARTFAAFPLGTQFWGADIRLVDATDTLQLTVTGGSGVLALEASGISFVGFTDPLGITSVGFENLGTDFGGGNVGFGNYSFDNVTTAPSPIAVPEPGTVALIVSALAGAWTIARRRAPRKEASPSLALRAFRNPNHFDLDDLLCRALAACRRFARRARARPSLGTQASRRPPHVAE
jgi:hypothetical protein